MMSIIMDSGGLAGAVGADEPQYLALLYAEGDFVHHVPFSVGFDHINDFNCWHETSFPRPCVMKGKGVLRWSASEHILRPKLL
jgi:hypothetical protein